MHSSTPHDALALRCRYAHPTQSLGTRPRQQAQRCVVCIQGVGWLDTLVARRRETGIPALAYCSEPPLDFGSGGSRCASTPAQHVQRLHRLLQQPATPRDCSPGPSRHHATNPHPLNTTPQNCTILATGSGSVGYAPLRLWRQLGQCQCISVYAAAPTANPDSSGVETVPCARQVHEKNHMPAYPPTSTHPHTPTHTHTHAHAPTHAYWGAITSSQPLSGSEICPQI